MQFLETISFVIVTEQKTFIVIIMAKSTHWWEKESLTPFKQQSSICIVGGTGSGKTTWTYKISFTMT
jgi:flagellar biosynthesis GTPase FlhF